MLQLKSKDIFFRPKRLHKFRKLNTNEKDEILQEYKELEEYEVINTHKISRYFNFFRLFIKKKQLQTISSQLNRDSEHRNQYRYTDIRARGPCKSMDSFHH